MERFVALLLGGGLALVAGLWLTSLWDRGSPWWLVGVGLAVVGIGALATGIARELET